MFPFYINIHDKICVIAGGGKVALRKISVLNQYAKHIIVIAPHVLPEIYGMTEDVYEREVKEDDIENAFIVVAATDNRHVNKSLADICRQRGVLVNSATDVDDSTFQFPAVIKNGCVTIGINSGGVPGLSGKLRELIEDCLPEDLDRISRELLQYRNQLKESYTKAELKEKMSEMVGIKLEQNHNRNTQKRPCSCADEYCC